MIKAEPIISIVIPVYNSERYLLENSRSILMQTYKNLDIIYINDGSTDNSLNILKAIASKDIRVKVLDKTNGGVSSARNLGIESAKGDYVCFVDADDMLCEDYVKYLLNIIITEGVKYAFCAFESGSQVSGCLGRSGKYLKHKQGRILKVFLYNKKKITCWNGIYSLSLLKEKDIYFDEKYDYGEDLHFVWRVLLNVDKVVELKDKLYFYRISNSSAMTIFNDKRLHSLDAAKDLTDYVRQYAPKFYPLFSKYCVAKYAWSIFWMSASALEYKQFVEVLRTQEYKKYSKKLLTYPSFKVSLSALTLLFSKKLFWTLSRTYMKRGFKK